VSADDWEAMIGTPKLIFVVLAALMFGGCSRTPDRSAPSPRQIRVILDYLPNAVHVGLYQADAAGYFREQGLNVRFDAPTSASDTLRLMAAGQAEFGVVSLLDFMNVRAKGEPLKIIMALEQRPLAAVIALKKSGINRPRDLDGRLVGTTGVLSDEAGVKWMVQQDGGNPASVRLINIGFDTAQQLIAGNVDAAFGFWNQEGVQVAAHHPANVMRLYNYGAPLYPELIVFAREDFLMREPGIVRGFVRAVVEGYHDALLKPDVALVAMAERVDGETPDGLRPYFEALSPALTADAPVFGHLNISALRNYVTWTKQIGALDLREDPTRFATNEYLPPFADSKPGNR
jgi:putative hydroxymethylpyrimidine transport system substrate-binding protein